MTMITAEIDGQTFPVDLSRVSGLDALAYRHALGVEIDALILGWLESGRVPAFLSDLAVVRWLWERQNVDPLASLPVVASQVFLLPSPEAPEAPATASEAVAGASALVAEAAAEVDAAERALADAQAGVVTAAADLAAARRDVDPPDGVAAPAPDPAPVAPDGAAMAEVAV